MSMEETVRFTNIGAARTGGPRLRQLRVGGRFRRRRLLPALALRPCLQCNKEDARGHARGPKALNDVDHDTWFSDKDGRCDGKVPFAAKRPSARRAAPHVQKAGEPAV